MSMLVRLHLVMVIFQIWRLFHLCVATECIANILNEEVACWLSRQLNGRGECRACSI